MGETTGRLSGSSTQSSVGRCTHRATRRRRAVRRVRGPGPARPARSGSRWSAAIASACAVFRRRLRQSARREVHERATQQRRNCPGDLTGLLDLIGAFGDGRVRQRQLPDRGEDQRERQPRVAPAAHSLARDRRRGPPQPARVRAHPPCGRRTTRSHPRWPAHTGDRRCGPGARPSTASARVRVWRAPCPPIKLAKRAEVDRVGRLMRRTAANRGLERQGHAGIVHCTGRRMDGRGKPIPRV